MSSWFSLAGRSIWVTGGAGYLGSAITAALDADGARVLCIDRGGRAAALVQDQRLAHTAAIDADLSDADGLNAFVAGAVEQHGVPDGVVHLAFASSAGQRLDQLTTESFQATFDLALTPTFVLCRELAERMKANGQRGSIVLASSMYGLVAPDPRVYAPPMTPNPIDYGASKAAVLQLARYFAVHYGPAGIRFNCITPGPFPNPGVQAAHPDFIAELSRRTPLHRIGQNAEIVGPTLFLLGEGASFVTGHSLVVDGGWTAW
jgi:NAD(P)-dependent dehydrogenase (short-subunit alcohol dehydrogenase family)